MSWMFKLRGNLKRQQRIVLEVIGVAIILIIWYILSAGESPVVNRAFLPSPSRVFSAYGELLFENTLIQNTFRSIGLNLAGYVKAIFWAIPIGFIIGLFPVFRGMFQRIVDAIRFIPLTAVTGIFIIWFGIQTGMKVNFLAFGILIYLLPIIVQRIDEVRDVYLKTVYTIGASAWQTITTVYIPSVMSRVFDDIRVLTAISWTYIIVAEGIGDQGGLGSMIFRVGQRQGRVDKTFAMLILIILIGVFQDRLFAYLDKVFFPYKYQVKDKHSSAIQEPSLTDSIFDFGFKVLGWSSLAVYILMVVNEYSAIITDTPLLDYLFGQTVWVIHVIFIAILAYKIWCFYTARRERQNQPADVQGK